MRRIVFLIILSALVGLSCAGKLGINLSKDPTIKTLKAYHEIAVHKWQETGIQVAEGAAIVLTPLYPKGFLYPIKGNIKGSEGTFTALDVDSEEIYKVKTAGTLRIGLDQNIEKPIQTGVFIFKNADLDSILADLTYVQSKNLQAKMVNLTLAILLKKKGESLALNNRYDEALPEIDRAIRSFQNTHAKMYSTSISRLYKLKAGIYKSLQNQNQFQENVNQSFEALIVASEYYGLLSQSRYSFLQFLTPEERYLLLTQTKFFQWQSDMRIRMMEDTLSTAFWFLSDYYTTQGNMSQSLAYAEKAIAEALKTRNKTQIYWAYHQLGWRHYFFGFYDLAYQSWSTGKNYCETEFLSYHIRQRIALSLFRIGKIKTVEEYRKFCGLPYSKYSDRWYTGLVFTIDFGAAQIHFKNKEYNKAIKIYEDLLLKSTGIPHFYMLKEIVQFAIALDLGECYLATGRLNDCLTIIKKLQSGLENIREDSPLGKLLLNYLRASAAERMGDDPISALINSIKDLEQIRPTAFRGGDYEFWERALTTYDKVIGLLYQKADFEQALSIAEKARSRRFLDYLGSKQLGVKNKSVSMAYQQADAILQTMSNIENDMVNAAQSAGIKLRTVYQEGTRYTQQLESYRSKLKAIAKSDQQFGIAHNIIPPSPREVQKKLPPDVTVLEYYLTDSALYAWVLDRKNINLVKQDLSGKELRDLVVAFRGFTGTDALKRDLTITRRVSKEASDSGEKLYARLISPVQKYITTQKVCIVPYGILNYLPFQALYDGEKYLVERYAISYIPSLSVLEFLGKGEKKEQYKVLAFGNPDLKDPAMDLPAAEKEVMEISSIYPDAQVFKREKATKGLLKKLSSQYDIIHFACHGQYVPEAPLASCIRLAPENEDDGRLEADEIFDMDMKADLIVTSACQTAIGQIGRGDEVVGLTRAFLYAGASSVLGSLWSISDEATAVFMKEFYASLKKFDKAEALRHAQLKMIQSKEYNNPFYWAAFNLTGSF